MNNNYYADSPQALFELSKIQERWDRALVHKKNTSMNLTMLMKLRKEGQSVAGIAKILGVTRTRIEKMVNQLTPQQKILFKQLRPYKKR